MAKAIIVVRLNTNLWPASWEVIPEDSGWFSVYPAGRENKNVLLHAREMASNATRTAFVVCAPNAAMEQRITDLAAASQTAWTLAELRADNGVLATGLKAVWRDKREDNGLVSLLSSMAGFSYPEHLETGA